MKALSALAIYAGLSLSASAATLDFSTNGTCAGDAGVTFSTSGSCESIGFRPDMPGNPLIGFYGPVGIPLTTVLASFASAVTYVSVELGDWGGDPDTVFLSIWDAGNMLLGSISAFRDSSSSQMTTLSLSGSGIAYATFGTSADDLGFIAADNFTYSTVPLPAGGLLLLGGLGMMGALKRRRT